MMMVDNVVALLRPQHDRYHVAANERADLMRLLLSQAFAFFLDLAHAYRDLGGTQAVDRDRLQNRLARVTHGFLPAMASWQRPITSIAGRAAHRRKTDRSCRMRPSSRPWRPLPVAKIFRNGGSYDRLAALMADPVR